MDRKKVGQRIRSIRLQMGQDQETFGSKNFKPKTVSKAAVSRWETGDTLPNSQRLKKIAELGDITVSELLNGSLNDLIDETADYVYSIYLRYFDDNSIPKTAEMKKLAEQINTYQDTSYYKDQDLVAALDLILIIDSDEYDPKSNRTNIKNGINFCSSEAKRKLSGWPSRAFNKSQIIGQFQYIADDHSKGYTPDNHGLLEASRDGLNSTILKLEEITGTFDGHRLDKLPKNINKSFYNEIIKTFNNTNDELTKIYSKYKK